MRTAILPSALLSVLALPASAQGEFEPQRFIGRWLLLGERSHYVDAAPERMTLVIEPAADGIAYRSDTLYPDGRIAAAQFTARLDATPALVVGNVGFLAPVSLVPATDGGIDATYRSGIRKVAWSHWSVSADGRELTICTTSLGPRGEETRNVAAFRKSGAD